MPLSFCFVGLLDIFILFWADMRKTQTKLLFLALVSVQLGYFIPPIETSGFTLNLAILLGAVFGLVGAGITIKQNQLIKISLYSLVVAIVYVSINALSHDYLLFFSPYYLLVALALCGLVFLDFYKKLFFSVLCYVLCESGTILVINASFQFYPLFTPDTMDCMIPLMYIILIECVFLKLIGRRKKIEKAI